MSKFVRIERINGIDVVKEIIIASSLPDMHPDLANDFLTFENESLLVSEGDIWDGESFTTPIAASYLRPTTQATILADLLVTKGVLLRADIPPELTSD